MTSVSLLEFFMVKLMLAAELVSRGWADRLEEVKLHRSTVSENSQVPLGI